MAFQTNVFRDGEWVTETVNLHSVLKSQKEGPRASARKDPQKPPRCGLLTRTLVESALANFILPVRLRSPDHNDIAFVGPSVLTLAQDHFVQICELQKEGRLKKIIRKNDFGYRIRNACVVGSFALPELNDEAVAGPSAYPTIKPEDDHVDPFRFESPRQPGMSIELPPQLLVLVLETGDSVFLFVQPGHNSRPKFVVSRFGNPKHMTGHLGFHLAVNPSSRYLAMGGPTDHFVVHELEPHHLLNERYLRNEPLRPIKSFRLRTVRGVIHKMTFLHPRPGDDQHIILLLVIVRHGKSRTVIYEWELGDDLKAVFYEEKQGHRMPVEHQMPLLLIPLTVQSAFISISPGHIAICTECLHGPPRFENREMATPAPTIIHRRHHQPLWTAWARPPRLQSYNKNHDCLYLAREDGVVLFIDADQDGELASIHIIDPFPCNISAAFACLPDSTTDVLVIGSDSGPGGYWKIPPRQAAVLLGTLPNWAPVVDLTTTDVGSGSPEEAHNDTALIPWQQAKPRKPDRIFATCEGGNKGSITELRYGLKANIGLDLEYGAGMRQAWFLRFYDPSSFDGYLLLLAMPDSTAALLLPSDFSSATAVAAGMIPYDLSSTTLSLVVSGPLTTQTTRHNIVLVNQHRSVLLPWHSLPGLSEAFVSDACVYDDCVAVSAHTDAQFQIHVFKIDPDCLTLAHFHTLNIDGEVTCLSLGAQYTILAGIRKGTQTLLAYASLKQPVAGIELVHLTHFGISGPQTPSLLEGIESIVSARDTIILGTRSGEVVTVENISGLGSVNCIKFGTSAAIVSCGYRAGATEPTILVCCDNDLVSFPLVKHGSHSGDGVSLKTKLRVWPVDASKPEAVPPPIHMAKVVDMPSDDGIAPILMISGSRLLLADMYEEPGPVHRSIPVEGAPNRVIYCQFTQCLVVAVNRYDGPNLVLINPDTGEDVGKPTDKNKVPQPCIAGLGKEGDRIFGLAEWNYKRDGNVWNFILVTTKSGRLIVVTTEKLASRDGGQTTFRYWTRFRKEVADPIYSVIGYDEGLIYCAGQTIHWEVLDTQEKRLKPLKSFALGSPATSLRISNDKLVALTHSESLVVLDNLDTDEANTRLCHVDPWRRNGFDSIEIALPDLTPKLRSGINLVADRECGVAGLWIPWDTPDRECEVVFEAELSSSIRRFRRARTRPVWEQQHHRPPRYGRLPATADDAEILGVSLNGALYGFTLLSVEAWRLLRFLQNLAGQSAELCPFATSLSRQRAQLHGQPSQQQQQQLGEDGDPEPKLAYGLEMQVDGDVLRRCLERRALERLVWKQGHVKRLMEFLADLDGGLHTAGLAEGDHKGYFQLAYQVLEYYLSPAL
ncbi:hypothetical protein N657DRAFT_654749 [Parathielavia appendiculata]|uniref:RSE1/DDB1/CPSF1 first beta-propeller domain-containing protein n=1 Tax=Parathielavia appendiculata TaxID=2587402 RepID=A0AAN6U7B7_9PEZI|nr:hypothetical protein N657DRAFT_654749 [Parathielavia appendiculata]